MPQRLLLLSWLKGAALIRGRRLLFQRGVTVLILLLRPAMAHGAGGGYCGGAGSVRKGIAAAAHNAKLEILYLLDETFIISAQS